MILKISIQNSIMEMVLGYFYFPLFFSMAITFFPAKPLIFEQALNKVWSRFSWITRYKTVIRLS